MYLLTSCQNNFFFHLHSCLKVLAGSTDLASDLSTHTAQYQIKYPTIWKKCTMLPLMHEMNFSSFSGVCKMPCPNIFPPSFHPLFRYSLGLSKWSLGMWINDYPSKRVKSLILPLMALEVTFNFRLFRMVAERALYVLGEIIGERLRDWWPQRRWRPTLYWP